MRRVWFPLGRVALHQPRAPATDVGGPAPPEFVNPFDPWAAQLERLDDAAALTGASAHAVTVLRSCRRILEVAVPVRRDDGHVESSPAGASITTLRAVRPRVGSAFIPRSRARTCRRSRSR